MAKAGMTEKIKKMPEALKKQVLVRLCGGLPFLSVGLFLLWGNRDGYLLFPCLLCFFLMTGNGIWLFWRCVQGRYIRLQGKCIRLETVGRRKRARAVYLSYETGVVRLPADGWTGKIREGDVVCAYIAEDAPVYEKDGIFWVRDHYALEIGKK